MKLITEKEGKLYLDNKEIHVILLKDGTRITDFTQIAVNGITVLNKGTVGEQTFIKENHGNITF